MLRVERKKKEKELEEANIEISDELQERLEQLNINPDEFKKLKEYLEDIADLDDANVLYQLDPGKNRSFGNWFREGINEGKIENEEIIEIFKRLRGAPKSLTAEDLGALVTYSYEYRRFDTKAVIGGAKDDLLYLDSLKDDDDLVKKYGKPNLDKHYVRPATRFRERKGIENVTIREKLGEPESEENKEKSKMSFLEGLGILLHFQNIEETRIQANRDFANKYGVGNHWNYILREIKPVFEEVKKELAEEYKKYGKIIKEHVLTDKEYNVCKRFLEKSRMGRKRTERENYLRMHSIREFREIAPVIVSVGRKLRYARRKFEETGDEWLKHDVIKQEYMLKEEFEENFEELTGIEDDPGDVIDMLANAKFMHNNNFQRFQKEHGETLAEMYKNGLIAKKYLKPTGENRKSAIERYHNIAQEEGVRKVDEKTRERIEKINEYSKLPYVKHANTSKTEGLTWMSGMGFNFIYNLHRNFEDILESADYQKIDEEKFKEDKRFLEKQGRVSYFDAGERQFAKQETYDIDWMTKSRGKNGAGVVIYDVKRIAQAVQDINEGVEADEILINKLNEVAGRDNLIRLGMRDAYYPLYFPKDQKVIVSKALKEKTESLYEKLRKP